MCNRSYSLLNLIFDWYFIIIIKKTTSQQYRAGLYSTGTEKASVTAGTLGVKVQIKYKEHTSVLTVCPPFTLFFILCSTSFLNASVCKMHEIVHILIILNNN